MSVTFLKQKSSNLEKHQNHWKNQQIADFYRAVELLRQAGIDVEVDSGFSDEGDPWFVFLRPESGDVVAHFAQIDGSFVAVSSLSHEIYKGKDIRSIVDEMLRCHPALLPQSKGSGKLLLHPTAAISAFLAAAFILGIDGIKTTSVKDVIFNVKSIDLPTGERGRDLEVQLAKSELLKGIFSDLHASNYNVAILGAALIIHELADVEFEVASSTLIASEGYGEFDELIGQSNEKGYVPVANLENGLTPTFDYSDAVSTRVIEMDADGGTDKSDHIDAKSLMIITKDEEQSNFKISETSPEVFETLVSESSNAWNGRTPVPVENYSQTHAFEKKSTNVKTSPQAKPSHQKLDSSEEVFAEKMENIFAFSPDSFSFEQLLLPDSLGVSVDATGDLTLVSLQDLVNLEEGNQRIEMNVPYLETGNGVSGFVPITARQPSETKESSENPSVGLGVAPVATQQAVKPIIGHSLDEMGDELHLTSALDVVFYDGGNSTITDFELGTDLLWFFLEPKDLVTAQNRITSDGDLILDFGEIGTLTFLGMIADPQGEVIV